MVATPIEMTSEGVVMFGKIILSAIALLGCEKKSLMVRSTREKISDSTFTHQLGNAYYAESLICIDGPSTCLREFLRFF